MQITGFKIQWSKYSWVLSRILIPVNKNTDNRKRDNTKDFKKTSFLNFALFDNDVIKFEEVFRMGDKFLGECGVGEYEVFHSSFQTAFHLKNFCEET